MVNDKPEIRFKKHCWVLRHKVNLLVLSIPVMNSSRVSLPSRSWSMRRKISRTRDLLSRNHLLNCNGKKNQVYLKKFKMAANMRSFDIEH